ncbi:hypothetical protein BQ1740_3672 [Bacillus subtilis]|nr:hypothetical protein BQ1740_3672 [Bacillus subtilis]
MRKAVWTPVSHFIRVNVITRVIINEEQFFLKPEIRYTIL